MENSGEQVNRRQAGKQRECGKGASCVGKALHHELSKRPEKQQNLAHVRVQAQLPRQRASEPDFKG